ncbi:hypothetical protein [Natronoglycomyces albus]|uniref:Uncharacterized protein n=1 Tax=Natronoglycomyces albus TaxID=2811108 RepID=A0A895XJH9_9ACTN|nr:hypothetical protein [Natronoglycomyces albus]QSB05157.1 hypothetical protein JQS30_15590 [Natronoglycomyces albus]
MTKPTKVRFAAVFATQPKPVSPLTVEAERVDRAHTSATGVLELLVFEPRTSHLTNLEPEWVENPSQPSEWQKTTMPLVAIDGEAVPVGRGRAHVTLDEGEHLVEVKDDHHFATQTVTIVAEETLQLCMATVADQRSLDILLGPREYIDRRAQGEIPPRAMVGGVIALACLAFAIIGVLLVAIAATALGHEGSSWSLVGLAAGVVPGFFHDPLARLFERRKYVRMFDGVDVPPGEAVAPSALADHPVMVVPLGAPVPKAPASLCLRVRPSRDALHLISFWAHGLHDRRHRILFYSNSYVDWLSPPEVSVNGHSLPQRWGNWVIPVRPGPHRVQVTLRGFRDPSTGEQYGLTSPITESIDVEVPEGKTQFLDCEFNPVALVRERIERHPGSEPYWYEIMRKAASIDTPQQNFDTHMVLEAERVPKLQFIPGQQLNNNGSLRFGGSR